MNNHVMQAHIDVVTAAAGAPTEAGAVPVEYVVEFTPERKGDVNDNAPFILAVPPLTVHIVVAVIIKAI